MVASIITSVKKFINQNVQTKELAILCPIPLLYFALIITA